MKIILLKDVAKFGKKYDIKEVSDGHAINMLIPRGFAISATAEAVKRINVEKAKIEGERKVHEDLLIKNLKDLDGVTLTINSKTNEKGHLFAGLRREDIVLELKKQTQLEIAPESIELDHPIKEVGDYVINVNSGGRKAKFKMIVVSLQ